MEGQEKVLATSRVCHYVTMNLAYTADVWSFFLRKQKSLVVVVVAKKQARAPRFPTTVPYHIGKAQASSELPH